MIRPSAVTLISSLPDAHGIYDAPAPVEREVGCDVMSVSRAEMYEALSHGMHPTWVLILSDYAEYQDELMCRFEGSLYKILRTYVRPDSRIELTVEKVMST